LPVEIAHGFSGGIFLVASQNVVQLPDLTAAFFIAGNDLLKTVQPAPAFELSSRTVNI
jgi:hypothetical protein